MDINTINTIKAYSDKAINAVNIADVYTGDILTTLATSCPSNMDIVKYCNKYLSALKAAKKYYNKYKAALEYIKKI